MNVVSCDVHPHRTGGEVKSIGLFRWNGETHEEAYARWAVRIGKRCSCLDGLPPEVVAKLVRDAATEPEQWWWLSFCDGAKPKGSQFLGCVVIQGCGIGWACHSAHALGVNPGGECAGYPFPAGVEPPKSYRHRLLTRAECEQLDAELVARPA